MKFWIFSFFIVYSQISFSETLLCKDRQGQRIKFELSQKQSHVAELYLTYLKDPVDFMGEADLKKNQDDYGRYLVPREARQLAENSVSLQFFVESTKKYPIVADLILPQEAVEKLKAGDRVEAELVMVKLDGNNYLGYIELPYCEILESEFEN